MIRSLRPLLFVALLPLVGGCDNVGRAFDRDVDPPATPPEAGTSNVQVVPAGGDVRDGRPKVRATYPSGGGWPSTVPIVVEFNESVNEGSLRPSTPTGTNGRIGVRPAGSTTFLPCQYDFVAAGRLLIMRPLTALPAQPSPNYEVVLLPEARDCDGVRFQAPTGGTVLSTFQVNQATSFVDGRILALYPRDNADDLRRDGAVHVIFDRPANRATLTPASMALRQAGGASLTATLEVPFNTGGVDDVRYVRVAPAAALSASSQIELVVTDAITFGANGKLDFKGRTPFARLRAIAPASPTLVVLANPLAGFPNKINRQNIGTAALAVTTPADALVGDRVRARIYGGDASTSQTSDLLFVERVVQLTADGAQTVSLDFSGTLGAVGSPRLDDGSITFAAQMQRGSQTSGFVRSVAAADPRFDIAPPTLQTAGPPNSPDGADVLTDLEYLAFYGRASEAVAEATLADGVNPTAALYASAADGRLLAQPLAIGRLTAPRTYSLLLTDRAGNLAVAPSTGRIVQRGLVTGTLAGTLTVEAFDAVSLRAIAGATVLVDPATPTVPATVQQVAVTDANGRAVFTVAGSAHSVTIVRQGYDLITLLDTQAAFVSLPLRPTGAATATLKGTATFQSTPGVTVITSSSAVADRNVMGVRSTTAAPTTIPDTPILANRPQVVTAFAGSFEPTTTPTIAFQGCQLLGPTLTTPTAPPAPAGIGGETVLQLPLVLAVNPIGTLLGPHTEDFASATGLDLGNLVGGKPKVRVTASLRGFSGQVVAGIGLVTNTVGSAYSVNASYSLPILAGLLPFVPVTWLVTEAEDTTGRLSRTRVLLIADSGTIVPGVGPTPIPVVTAPSGPSTGSPAVTFVDGLNPTIVPGGIGIYEVTAAVGNGRRWTVLTVDRDANIGGSRTVQFPDLTAGGVAGLGTGTWNVQVETRLFVSVTASSADDFVLSERFRQEANYARSRTTAFTVQ
jgi:hypothetical protein